MKLFKKQKSKKLSYKNYSKYNSGETPIVCINMYLFVIILYFLKLYEFFNCLCYFINYLFILHGCYEQVRDYFVILFTWFCKNLKLLILNFISAQFTCLILYLLEPRAQLTITELNYYYKYYWLS
jgi:hypothetical protein